MGNLEGCPTKVKESREDGIVQVLMRFILTVEHMVDWQVTNNNKDQSSDVPGGSLSFIRFLIP